MLEHIVCHTLIDISDASALQRQNLNTLVQTVSLRANPMNIKVAMMANQPMADYDFGENFGGNHNVWILSFTVEQASVYENKSGPIGGLIDDVHHIPIIANLMESVSIDPEVFDTKNDITKNTYFNLQKL
jgi:hypothetical protein